MKNILKNGIILTITLAGILAANRSAAQDKGVQAKVGFDFVSSYIWRGCYNANASVQPTLGITTGNFSVTAWGSVDFDGKYKEADLTAAYAIGGLTLSLTDYYWTPSSDRYTEKYFRFGADSPHMVEVGAAYNFGERFPLTLAWNTMLFGADRDNDGKQNYSTYAEISYPFAVRGVDMVAAVGFTPWATENMYGTTGFAVSNVSLGATKAIRFSDKFSLPVFTRLIWNPAREDVNFVGGFSIML